MSEHFERLIIGELQGKLTPAQKTELDQWRSRDEKNQRAYDEMTAVWSKTKSSSIPAVDSNAEWTRLKDSIETTVAPTRSIGTTWVLRAAASVAFLLLCSYLLYISFGGRDVVTIATTTDTLSVKLPDGSRVTLNKDTRISYVENFQQDRSVDLSGEAFFDVQKDPDHPFVVNTPTAKVRVLGTSFNVNTKTNRGTQLHVVSGVVRFSSSDEVASVEFRKGESGLFSAETKNITRTIALNPTAWKDKMLVFKDTPLSDVVESLDAYFDRDFVLAEHLAHCTLTAEFKNPDIEEVLNVLREVFALDIVRDGEHYVLNGEGCELHQ